MRESGNFRPIRNDTDAENYTKSNQQCETRWPAVMLVFIDIRHDIYLPSKPSNQRQDSLFNTDHVTLFTSPA
jgi:hypothetical protein